MDLHMGSLELQVPSAVDRVLDGITAQTDQARAVLGELQ